MGFGFPAALGAQIARPHETVLAFVGDGGFQMTSSELATASEYQLPVKIFVFDNQYLGMVRQWQELFFDNRLSGVDLRGNPDFLQLALAYGVKGFSLASSESVPDVLRQVLAYRDGPCLVHVKVEKQDNVFPMVPAGKSLEDMVMGESQ